jgi:hypothetical protein
MSTGSLPLFGSCGANGATDSATFRKDEAYDRLLFVGGPVWGLDWCPGAVQLPGKTAMLASRSQPDSAPVFADYMAVGCHPKGHKHNRIGNAVQGPGVLQIWEVLRAWIGTAEDLLPRMVLGIVHDAGLVWHCRWCPVPGLADGPSSSSAGELPRLGLLGAALGDGSVRVWAVPQPRSLRSALGAPPPSGDPLLAAMRPVAHLHAGCLGTALPSLLDWLPAPPHDLLLIGHWDGSVAVMRLTPSQQQQAQHGTPGEPSSSGGVEGMELLLHFPAEVLPIRALKWMPAPLGAPTLDQAARHLFLTAGHEGTVKIWDGRCAAVCGGVG